MLDLPSARWVSAALRPAQMRQIGLPWQEGDVREVLPRRTVALIVRIWGEYLDRTPPEWLGEVERVSDQVVARFASLSQLSECIRRLAGAAPSCPEQQSEEKHLSE